ncbi:hypothetical protein GO013_03105 [Pseudodesulfovibrio sp. JC047]|uniref:hypothetical protein n=1 Tax=Pseudodesulfovibrio sp. JC047 TaxID=2683199 RepID=UPI0013D5867B|nr:hypothetical protein [Pseudodesulfovibrio sp. JC047]NDV18406.1 hypothetical protein [Pseudodesulfovibrio sp. JC047]
MHLISWTWFWYVLIGFLMGGGATYLFVFLKEKSIRLKWMEWIGVVVVFLLFMFMGQTFIASFQEGVARAAWLTVVFMGLPMLVVAVLTMRSVRKRLTA